MKVTLEQQKKGQELYNELVQKAWESVTFKEQLISNPKAVIAETIGEDFNSDAVIVIEDQTDNDTVYLNIPAKPNFENLELTDEQLEIVSGGEVFATAGIILGAAAVGATLFGTGVLIYQVTHQ